MTRKTNTIKHPHKKVNPQPLIKNIIGFISYFIIFVVIIPLLLYRAQQYNFLEVYLPNVDLIANLLTWSSGPYDIWSNLYKNDDSISRFTSRTLINYMALLGLTFIIARETKRTNNIFAGWSMAFVMLLTTYLLPTDIVTWFMEKAQNFSKTIHINKLSTDILSLTIGIIITLTFLGTEIIILQRYRKHVKQFAKYVYGIPKKLNM